VWLSTIQGGPWQIYIYSLATGEYRPLAGTERANFACWSPDSRYIAALNPAAGELRKIEAATGGFSVLAKTKASVPAAWSTNGVVLFGDGAGSLYRVPAQGGTPQKVLSLAAGESFGPLADFLPDGDHFLFGVSLGGSVETKVASLGGSQPKAILQSTSPAIYSPTGQLLFVRNDALLAQAFDASKLALSGSPITFAPSVNTAGLRSFSVSGNGILTYHPGGADAGQRLTWFDRSGRKLGEVGAPDRYTNPALSPDGKRLAVGIGDIDRKNRDIWVFDLVRGGSYRLTFDPADDLNPVWSPDGRYIAFASDRKGKRDLYRKLASGTGEEEVLFENQTDQKVTENWSHDGRYIFTNVLAPHKPSAIYLFSSADRKFEKYISGPSNTDKAQLSPDGRWLAYRAQESGRDEVYLQPFPATGERWQVSTAGGNDPQWRGDSKELYFLNGNNISISAVDIKPSGNSIEIGIPHALFETRITSTNFRNRYVPTADGQKFLVVVDGDASQIVSFETVMNWPEMLRGK
jgi:Tol biopolymer transport system component